MAAVVAICKSHAPSTVLVEDTYGTSVATLAEVQAAASRARRPPCPGLASHVCSTAHYMRLGTRLAGDTPMHRAGHRGTCDGG